MKFSVLLPTRNRPNLILHAVRSVVLQTHEDWELILLDNSDEPYPYRFLDPRIRYEHMQCRGVAHASNEALARATGDVIVPLGDDDRLPPDTLSTSMQLFGDNSWLNGKTLIHNESGHVLAERGGTRESLDRTLAGEYWLGGAIHWRRELTDKYGGYPERYDGAADFKLYLDFLRDSPPALTDHVMYLYLDWPGTDSRQRAQNQAARSREIAANAA